MANLVDRNIILEELHQRYLAAKSDSIQLLLIGLQDFIINLPEEEAISVKDYNKVCNDLSTIWSRIADTTPKKGHWIIKSDWFECSNCSCRQRYWSQFNFCPYCGADMREGE